MQRLFSYFGNRCRITLLQSTTRKIGQCSRNIMMFLDRHHFFKSLVKVLPVLIR